MAEGDKIHRGKMGLLESITRVRIPRNYLLALPVLTVTAVYVYIPLLFIFVMSFLQSSGVSLESYVYVSLAYGRYILETLLLASQASILMFILAFPVAYCLIIYITSARTRLLILFSLLAPFWVDWTSRVLSWFPVIGERGFINIIIESFYNLFGLQYSPVRILFTRTGVLMVWLQSYFLFMLIPIYLSLINLDKRLLLAAETLGANRLKSFYHITFKMALPGIVCGFAFTLAMCFADYGTPTLIGGGLLTIGSSIASLINWYKWSEAMALTVLSTIPIFFFIVLMLKLVGMERLLR